ncbi:MAG: amidohydrolase family protein [Proteobacteria bacterium]|nr:amidohydrolase family protein [Pseudomonadota bacterium]MBU1581443.1 amidohydrolase family protein [Pseudomonadota bacterium]MBU2452260.1 amidohydrolase family protein [Pseudomonadota bacterium]MBU2630827.1 amidohydrolase family protein [Pseudomonadota bacterium]
MINSIETIVCNGSSHRRELHRAGWIIVDSSNIIENGYLEIENGFIRGVHKGRLKEKCIDHGPGIIMPPLVNTHLHLELSALKGSMPFDKGFEFWVKTLLEKREALGKEKLIKEARKAARQLMESGNRYVGEISTLGITESIIKDSGLKGVFFHEFLGSNIQQPWFIQKTDSVSSSVAGHAPHTSSPRLLMALKKCSGLDGLPFCIHVAESDDETRFIRDKKGAWADFLTLREIDWSSWDIGSKTPVQYVNDMGLLDPLTIVVHALTANDADMELLARSKTKVCVCPRSNWNLHGKLPDIKTMIKKGIQPALGTDSLASCDSLNIFDEMAFVQNHYPGLDPAIVFSMATINGARALGFEQITGTLSKGKKAEFLYRSVCIKNKKDLFQRIISND